MGRTDGGLDDGQEVVMPHGPLKRQVPGSEEDAVGTAVEGGPPIAGDSNWQVTERLLRTLNQELGGLKEYVLTELRGEITSLRSEKVQLQSEVQELRHQQEQLVSDRQQAQQLEWAQQFAQAMTQTLRQEIQTQVLDLAESGETAHPGQRLIELHQQMVSCEESLGAAIQTLQLELGQHQSELSQQLLRMQNLEQQGETLLAALAQQLQRQQQAQPNRAGTVQATGMADGAAMSRESATRSPGHPTDVGSVMATMASLQPPGGSGPSAETQFVTPPPPTAPAMEQPGAEPEAGDSRAGDSRAAAMLSPPRLTMPAPVNTPGVENEAGSDESFIAAFPIDMVRPGAKMKIPAPAESGSTPVGGDSEAGEPLDSASPSASFDMNRPDPSQGMSLDEFYDVMDRAGPVRDSESLPRRAPSMAGVPKAGGIAMPIAMPPGMVDRFKNEGEQSPQEVQEAQAPDPWLETTMESSSPPWVGEPPTIVASLMELTDGQVNHPAGPGEGKGEGEMAVALTAPVVSGAGVEKAAFSPRAVPLESSVGGDGLSRSPETSTRLQRSSVAIALVTLFLWAVQYGTVQILFHGAAWIADGEGFIAATWGSALVTYWIRMLMVLPFMIVIGQGLYPPLLPEMQAVFRDRDRIPLISIAASSLFFFLAHFLLYGSIARSSATPAISLFFLYPALGQFLGWGLFNQRLSPARLWATVPLGLGIFWLLMLWTADGGRIAGLASGLCYALFLMLTAVNGRRMNPMTLTVLQFALAWGCAFPALFFLPQVVPTNDIGYVMACAVLSGTLGLSQLCGLAGRRRFGGGLSSVIQGTVPLVVGLFCLFLTDEVLPILQVLGVLMVSAGAIALGVQRVSRDPVR